MKKFILLVVALAALALALTNAGISDGSWAAPVAPAVQALTVNDAAAHVNDSCPFLGATKVWSYYNYGGHAYYTQSTCQMHFLGLWREWGPVSIVYIY